MHFLLKKFAEFKKKLYLCIENFRHASRRTAYQGGTFSFHMRYTKKPISVANQIALLKDRGLVIKDEQKAEEQLKIISYFRLADYLQPLETDHQAHAFKENATFEKALDLYYFDKELRALLFTAIQSVEVALRSKMIHHCAMAYGAHWFMNESLFKDKNIFETTLKKVVSDTERSKEEYIKEYFRDYSEPMLPPAWKTLEVITFGSLSKMYENLREKAVKREIAREMGVPTHLILENWIQCTAVMRNLCCHHNRVWNRAFAVKPQLPERLNGRWISKPLVVPVKLYWQLCVFQYLEDAIHPENTFRMQLQSLLARYPMVDVRAMGFPLDWKQEELWKQEP